eukprot:3397326-Rhodomonas_salina.2
MLAGRAPTMTLKSAAVSPLARLETKSETCAPPSTTTEPGTTHSTVCAWASKNSNANCGARSSASNPFGESCSSAMPAALGSV